MHIISTRSLMRSRATCTAAIGPNICKAYASIRRRERSKDEEDDEEEAKIKVPFLW